MARAREITGKTVLITGAARGIGRGVAERMAERGANVALVGLEPERLEALAGQIGERALWHEADATDSQELERAVARTTERFGGVDVAVANAGVHWTGAFATAPIAQLERELEINLFGVLRTGRAVLPQLIERGGYLLNIASLAAAAHGPLLSTYSASKAGVEALSNSMRQELASQGVTVGCAYFSFIETDMVRDGFAHPAAGRALRLLPGFFRKPAPLDAAVAAIEGGIMGRKHRVWAPRHVGPLLAIRGLAQPLTELRSMRSGVLAEAVELAATEQDLDLSGARREAASEPVAR